MRHFSSSHSSYGNNKGVYHDGNHGFKVFSHHSSVLRGSSYDINKSSCLPHQGGQYKAYTSNGSKRLSFSRRPSVSFGHGFGSVRGGLGNNPKSSGSYGAWRNNGLLNTDGKETMKILNERLASYLEKVHSLEKKNAEFERKICEWYANNAPSSLPDTTQYMRTIQGLESQINSASTENSRILLQIDNASLAAEDLRIKYEIEAYLRTKTEADVATLCQGLGDLGRELQNLDVQVKCLDEELLQLNTNHEEEVNMLQSQLGARVNVKMNTAPSVDLNKALSQVRDEYEKLMERNLNEIEAMFLQRTAELGQQVTSGAEQLQSVNNELIDLKRSAQTLDIELQNETRMKCAMEEALLENEASYGSQLSQLQVLIDKVEAQLSQILSDLKHLNFKYQLLMDQKTHLEKEISTYKHLLEAQDVQAPEASDFSEGSQDVDNNSVTGGEPEDESKI